MDKQFVSNNTIVTKMLKDPAIMAVAGNVGLVPSEGRIGAKVMFVGESPTKLNTELGRPFMGMGGSILNSILADSGLKRDDVYITNVVRWLVSEDPKDFKTAAEVCRKYLLEEIKMVRPRIIIAFGKKPFEALTQKPINLRQDHGKVVTVEGYPVLATYHPNGLRYVRGGRRVVVGDILNSYQPS